MRKSYRIEITDALHPIRYLRAAGKMIMACDDVGLPWKEHKQSILTEYPQKEDESATEYFVRLRRTLMVLRPPDQPGTVM